MAGSDGPPRATLIAALVLAIGAIGTIMVIAVIRRAPQRPLAIPAVPAPQADDQPCRALLDALPARLGDFRRAAVVQPAPAGTAAWTRGNGDPVVLRCGLGRPADFVVGSPIQVVNRVQWFKESSEPPAGDQAGASTWYTVDRPVYIALTLPTGSGPTPIQQIADLVERTITAVPSTPAPPPG